MVDNFLSEATKEVKEAKEEDKAKISAKVMNEWMISEPEKATNNLCCMIYGKDGTGKSGIVLDFLTEDDVKEGKTGIIIDLDGGCDPLLRYHKTKLKNLIIKNPIEENPETYDIDYIKTFAKIKAIIYWVKKNHKEKNIKFIAFDGLSSALKFAEYQMRLDKHIDTDGGVQQRFWLKRNKYFLELLEQIKALPLTKFFVGHEEFIIGVKDDNVSAVKIKTNALMHQKVRCEKFREGKEMIFRAVIDKSKFNIKAEGSAIAFAKVDTETGEFKWKTSKIYDLLQDKEAKK